MNNNEKLKEILNSVNAIEAELAKVKTMLDEMIRSTLARQICDSCDSEEVLDTLDQADLIAWKKAHCLEESSI